MVDLPICCAPEYADARPLPAAVFFHQKIPAKSAVVAGPKPDLVPAKEEGPFRERRVSTGGRPGSSRAIRHVYRTVLRGKRSRSPRALPWAIACEGPPRVPA